MQSPGDRCDIVMKSNEACTSGTSRVLTVPLLQQLKLEALIPAPVDCEVRSVIKFLKNKQHRMLSAGVVLLHDNTRQHTARRSTHLLQFSSEVFYHPPYNLDLAPSDIHLFLHLKKFLSGQHQHFQNDREVEMSVMQWFQSQAADFYDTGIQKVVPRYEKYLNSGGEYVEK